MPVPGRLHTTHDAHPQALLHPFLNTTSQRIVNQDCDVYCQLRCRYGGVVVRPNIAAKADWYIMSIQQFIDALEKI